MRIRNIKRLYSKKGRTRTKRIYSKKGRTRTKSMSRSRHYTRKIKRGGWGIKLPEQKENNAIMVYDKYLKK